MKQLSEMKQTLQTEQQRLDAKYHTNKMAFSTFNQLQVNIKSCMETLMTNQRHHNIHSRDLAVHADAAPPLGPHHNHPLGAISYELCTISPGESKRSLHIVPRPTQSQTRKETMAGYTPWLGVLEPGDSRCCITGEWLDTENLRRGHVVPRCLSEDLVGYVVGETLARFGGFGSMG